MEKAETNDDIAIKFLNDMIVELENDKEIELRARNEILDSKRDYKAILRAVQILEEKKLKLERSIAQSFEK